VNINRASDLLRAGEVAIVLFTKSMHLVNMNPDGSGTSGNWHSNPNHHDRPDKVIIYNRLLDRVPQEAEIYLAKYVDAVESQSQGRLVIQFQNAMQVGTTRQNWYEFADTGTNPVRYLSKR
jgi:hypothetical protein